jgi:hypothetical protein
MTTKSKLEQLRALRAARPDLVAEAADDQAVEVAKNESKYRIKVWRDYHGNAILFSVFDQNGAELCRVPSEWQAEAAIKAAEAEAAATEVTAAKAANATAS